VKGDTSIALMSLMSDGKDMPFQFPPKMSNCELSSYL